MMSPFIPTSATWPDGVRRLSRSYLKDPMIVYVGTLDLAVSWFFAVSNCMVPMILVWINEAI